MTAWTSHRRTRARGLPITLRARILHRDHWQCQIRTPNCTHDATEVDHHTPVWAGGTDDEANLRATCTPCHALKTQSEAQEARRALGRRRPPMTHPGLATGR